MFSIGDFHNLVFPSHPKELPVPQIQLVATSFWHKLNLLFFQFFQPEY